MTLSSRIEAASGPDRELDAEIWLAINRPGWRKEKGWKKTNGWASPDCPSSMVNYYTPDGLGGSQTAPDYTASLDAAVMLVGKDWFVEIKGPRRYLNIPTPVPNHWSANLETWDHEGQKMGWGATPALALAAAAIKIKESERAD